MKLGIVAFSALLFAFGVSLTGEGLFEKIKQIKLVQYSTHSQIKLNADFSGSGNVQGKVFITSTERRKSRKQSRGLYTRRTSRLRKSNVSSGKRAVVFVRYVPGTFPVPQIRPKMKQKNIALVPHILPILVGTKVDFPNEDPIFHNIFSLSKTRPFDLGRYGRGKSKVVTFDRVGPVRVFCDIHSEMSGHILVFQNPYFTLASMDGTYQIKNVPAGEYTIGAWHEGHRLIQKEGEIRQGKSLNVNFSF